MLSELKTSERPVMQPITHSARRINRIADRLKPPNYLEIGVEKAVTFLQVDIENKIAVDPNFCFDPTIKPFVGRGVYHPTSSDEFFSHYAGPDLGLVFLDGLHHSEQTLRDLLNVLVFSNSQTVILIDDVVPSDVFSSLRDHSHSIMFREMNNQVGGAWHGDVFRVIFFLHDFFPTLSYATIEGGGNSQTLIWRSRRKGFKPRFNSLETIERLSYFDLYNNFDLMNMMDEDTAIAKMEHELGL